MSNSRTKKKRGRPKKLGGLSNIEATEPPAIVQAPPIRSTGEGDRRFWPEDKPMPQVYPKVRRGQQPCPKCRRVLLDNGSQAAVCTHSGTAIAFFRCKACDHRWQLPVEKVEG